VSIGLTSGIVRILAPGGLTAGTGFVVTDDGLIATCAHVAQGTGAGLGDTVRVVFHTTGEEREAQVERDWWRGPDAEDMAILRLDGSLPGEVTPVCLGSSTGVEGHALATFGFPDPKPVEGMAGKCEVVGRTTERGFPVLQLRSSEVTPGFSGAPVLDTVTRRVVGMVTAITVPDQYGRLAETAFIIPTETLRAVCPKLQLSDLCPYRGLAAFTEDHTEFFFGREKLVADFVDHLQGNPRFLAVVGPSGSGKSSVVQAGLFPALRRGEVLGSGQWHLLTFRPGVGPFSALTSAGLDVPQESDLQAAIRAFLETHPQVKRLVLFADQFEELFTLCPQPVQERFLCQLLALLEGNLPVTLVLTLRADFYGHLLRYRPLVDWLKIGQINVPPMGQEELRAVVEEPALRLGLRFETGVVEAIVEEAGTADHPLPLLESALTQLWGQREDGLLTHAAYQAVGRVAGAIGQWAEDTYTELTPQERLLAQRVFTRLVHYGEGEVTDTRQRQALSELVARPEEQESLHRLVRRLADARLLVTGGDPGAETVEIIHDALLQQWGRLRLWTAEQREFYLWRQRLDERLQEWEEQGQDEGALLRGALLAEAERWLGERSDYLNLDEQAYIQESVALQEREQMARERRQRRIALGLAAGLVVTIALALLAWWQRNQAVYQAQIALGRRLAAQAVEQSDQDGELSLLLAVEAVRRASNVQEAHSWEAVNALRQAISTAPVAVLSGVSEATFGPDGSQLAIVSRDGTVRLWDVEAGAVSAFLYHESNVTGVTYSDDGRQLAVIGEDNAVRIWDVEKGSRLAVLSHESRLWKVVFNPDGGLLATTGEDGTVRLWDTKTAVELITFYHGGSMPEVAFSPDGGLLATAGEDGIARLWDTATGTELALFHHRGPVRKLVFSSNGKLLVTMSLGERSWGGECILVWDVASRAELMELIDEDVVWDVAISPNGQWLALATWSGAAKLINLRNSDVSIVFQHAGPVAGVAFDVAGQWLVTAGFDGTIYVIDVRDMRITAVFGHGGEIAEVDYSPDGSHIATTDLDGVTYLWSNRRLEPTIVQLRISNLYKCIINSNGTRVVTVDQDGLAQLWDIESATEIATLHHEGAVRQAAFSSDGKLLVTGGEDGTARLWDTETGVEVTIFHHEGPVWLVDFSVDGKSLVTSSEDGTARLWDVETGRELRLLHHKSAPVAVALSSDGARLATADRDGRIWAWDVKTGDQLAVLSLKDIVQSMVFSPQKQDAVVLVMGDGTPHLWNIGTGELEEILHSQKNTYYEALFSPDSRRLAIRGIDRGLSGEELQGVVHLLDASTWREVATLRHQMVDPFFDIHAAFSPDGQWLATAGDDRVVNLVNAESGEKVMTLQQDGMVNRVAFIAQGTKLAATNWRGEIYIWRVHTEDLLDLACGTLTRNLDLNEWEQYLGEESYRPTCPNLPVPEE
jgi:WD40 repeat protein